MEKRRNSYKTRGNSTEKRSGPVGVGAAVGGTAVRRVPSSAARCSPVSSQKCSLLSQMLCLGFLGLFSAFGSFPFSIPSLLSVTFPPFFPSPPPPPPKWAAGGFLRLLIYIQPPPRPAPLLPPRTSAVSGRAACGAGAAPPRLWGYMIIIAIFSLFALPPSFSRSGGARRQRWGLRDTGGTRPSPGQRGLWALR